MRSAVFDTWSRERTLLAAALREVLTRRDLLVDPGGLRIRGARTAGRLDLSYVAFRYPLHLTQCYIEGPIYMNHAALRAVKLDGTHTHDLALDGAKIDGPLQVADCFTAYGEFRAVGAHIEGMLDLVGANLINPKSAALILGDTCIGGSMLANGLRAEGAVRAYLAHIGGALVLSSATLRNPDGEALVLNGAEITGGWVGGNGLRAEGRQITQPLDVVANHRGLPTTTTEVWAEALGWRASLGPRRL